MSRSNNDVVTVLSRWIRFANPESRADDLAAFCPFHKGGGEQTPAFYVYVGPETHDKRPGAAYCHACNEGWTYTGLLYKLGAARGVIDIIRQQELELRRARKRSFLYDLNFDVPELPEQVLAVFDYCPVSLLGAGFEKDILRNNDIGFDRDRQRVTFGLRDHHGSLVGVSGRTVIDEEPRYKIYKSEFYSVCPGYNLDKSKILWGLDKFYLTRLHRKTSGPVVICEGFKAAMWVKQAGYPHVVATIGSSISQAQRVLLQRVTSDAVLFFDNDAAGIKATWRNARTLGGIDVRVANYGTSQPVSPDDLAPDRVREVIETALPAPVWRRKNAKLGGISTSTDGEARGWTAVRRQASWQVRR